MFTRVLPQRGGVVALATLIVSAALLLVATDQASAAGEKGNYKGSQVYCYGALHNFGTKKVEVQALVSRYAGFSSQTVKYAHYLYNIDTRVWTPLMFSNRTYYWQFRDSHIIDPGWPYAPEPWRTWDFTNATDLPSGRYLVYTKYWWYNGYWAESEWVPASSYANNITGSGFMSYCSL